MDSGQVSVEQLRTTMVALMQTQRRHLERCAEPLGLSGQQAMALLKLGDGDGVSMRELADRMSCDPSYLTGIVDRLEDLGAVQRRTGTTDRRIKHLVVTPAGWAQRDRLLAAADASAPGLAALGHEERAQLLELLNKVLAQALEDERDGSRQGSGGTSGGPLC